jgi:geranylgeranyl pyrophosphate synthase
LTIPATKSKASPNERHTKIAVNGHDQIFAPVADDLGQVVKNVRQLAASSNIRSSAVSAKLSHVLSTPGKKIRPAITLLASRLFGTHGNNAVVNMATAVELLHIATLIHDDTVDSANFRRGMATASNLWGGNIAVLLGDFVFAASATFVCDTNDIRLIRRFSETIRELSHGELTEILDAGDAEVDRDSYLLRIYDKTASLFYTAAESGAVLGRASDDQILMLQNYGYNVGMAYQIKDDVLDFEASEQNLGKPATHDLASGILTMPSILLMERSPSDNPVLDFLRGEVPQRAELLKRAVEAVRMSGVLEEARSEIAKYLALARRSLDGTPDCRAKNSLLALADFTSKRSH